MVEVEEGGLGALEQHVLSGVEGVVHEAHGVGDVVLEAGAVLVEVAIGDLVGVERELVEDLGQDLVLLLGQDLELGPEDLRVEEVLHPQPHAGRLVGVGGPDAPLGGAELGPPEAPFGEAVDLLVEREDQVRVAADPHPRHVDAASGEGVHLLQQDLGIDDHAVGDHRGDVRVEDAAREQLQGVGLAVDHERVAGVVAPLVPHHHGGLLGDEVGEATLALVTPLGADQDGGGHCSLLGSGHAAARQDSGPRYWSPGVAPRRCRTPSCRRRRTAGAARRPR